MSDEITPPEASATPTVEPKQLPATFTRTEPGPFTWTRPAIMLGSSPDGTEMHLRNGASIQVAREITEEYGFEEVSEVPFKIIARSPVVFGGVRFDVLNENSEPKASDYLARVGNRTLIGFRCALATQLSKEYARPVFFIYRCYITLP